jgi:membrane protein required for beta-lactamase induction
MTLISLLIALFLDRTLNLFEEWRSLDFFSNYARKWTAVIGRYGDADSYLGLAFVLLPPLLLVSLLSEMLDGWIFGLVGMVFSVFILLLSLGKNPESMAEFYIEAVDADNGEALQDATEAVTGTREYASNRDRLTAFVNGLFIRANQNLYAVIFWFVLLGPLGAALYRLSVELRAQRDICGDQFADLAGQWVAVMDWAPARISALAMGVVGAFDPALAAVKTHLFNSFSSLGKDNAAVLSEAGWSSVQLDDFIRDEDVDSTAITTVLGLASNAIMRTLVAWIIIVAVMTIWDIV